MPERNLLYDVIEEITTVGSQSETNNSQQINLNAFWHYGWSNWVTVIS